MGTEAVTLAIVAAVSALITSVLNAYTNIRSKKMDLEVSNSDIKKLIEDNTKKTEDLNKKICNVNSTLKKFMEEQEVVNDTYREALKILLRQNIDDMYQLYYKNMKCMSKHAKEELEETFTIYKKLGGNHIGERRYLKMMELPEIDIEEL